LSQTSPPRSFVFAVGALGFLLAYPREASAFEGQLHLGGGAGVAFAGDGYERGPVLGLHAAYGVSDVFDLRLEVTGSDNGISGKVGARSRFYGARAGVAYKVDIIQWIPYVGVTSGVLGARDPVAPHRSADGTLGLVVGLDYALARNFGLGVAALFDTTVREPSSYGAVLGRAEYRLGW
jgi:hypothetical protein